MAHDRVEPVAATTATARTFAPNNKRPTIVIYPTVSTESVVVPIISCIVGFPLVALLVICCLRKRAKMARDRDRRRNCDMDKGTLSVVRFRPVHRLYRERRPVSFRSDRDMTRGFPSLELDTVVEERSDPEQTQIELVTPDRETNGSKDDDS